MGLRLWGLNAWLRLTAKQPLKRMRDPLLLRRRLERDAARFFVVPEGASFASEIIRTPCLESASARSPAIPVTWARSGRAEGRKVILYLHGGAYLAGSARTHRHLAAALSRAAAVRSLLPDYRLAPEHRFPAALDDAMAVYGHLIGSGYEPGAIAVAGDSAGGGLAFALVLLAARGGLPPPGCVVGFSPWVDLTGQQPSLVRNARRDVMLPAGRISEVVRFYLGEHDPADPLASPLFGAWRDPPPALITASRSEILVDEATALAEVLRRGGGDVRLELWSGLPHAWPIFTGLIREADETIEHAGAFIAQHLAAGR